MSGAEPPEGLVYEPGFLSEEEEAELVAELEPRSAYVLGGAARSGWEHSIPPTKSLRYSVTFRTLKRP